MFSKEFVCEYCKGFNKYTRIRKGKRYILIVKPSYIKQQKEIRRWVDDLKSLFKPIQITSGIRCKSCVEQIKTHEIGKAVDIEIDDELKDKIVSLGGNQLTKYDLEFGLEKEKE